MQEALKKVASSSVESVNKTVTLCVRSQRFRLNGIWNWEMSSPAVYCSDVMSFPDDFTGTKAIIHPDDLPKLMGALNIMEEKEVPRFDFRIITTYGEVKTISGQRVSIEDEKNKVIEPIPGKEPWEEVLLVVAAQRENDFFRLRNELCEYTERLHGIGSWVINRQTGQAWYSDNLFRIYGLAPQSLNAHANTFNQFIHKDDLVTVLDAFEKAYQEQAPLHIEYRVIGADGEVRYIQQITKWFYAVNGQEMFSGIVRDVTSERSIADELMGLHTQVSLHQQVLKISEQQTATGYWLTDLTTRKTSYSENYYRIYGFKQPFLPSYNSFINLVHSDDRAKVREHIEKMYNEHALSEIEFRIIRPDGKQRYIKQSGKVFISPNKELIMIGLVQDVSIQKSLEKKILELHENISLNNAVTEMMENVIDTSSLIWLPDGYMQWSDGFYRMLGYKPGGLEPLPRFLYKNIHPADLKIFKDAEALLQSQQNHDDIIIRLVSKGGMRKVKISFRQINYGKDAIVALVHDISRQSEISEQFTDNKLFTQLLEDSVNDLVIFTNIDNTVLYWNKVAEDKTNIAKDDALYRNLFEVLPQLNEENFLAQIHFAIRGQEGHSSRANGVYLKRPHDYWLWPLKNEAGEVMGVLHVIRDISKQLELQQQLNERLNFIESLVESSVDRIVVLDRFMNYLYWNKKAEEYYAINKERVLGKNILEIFPSFRNDPSYEQFRTVLRGETVYLPAEEDVDSDEYFETYLIPIKDENNDVTAVLWIVHDLTREYQLTKERTLTANLLQATLDASTEMVQVFEAVRNEEGEIVDFKYILLNNEAEKWMPDALGKTLLQLQPGVVEEGIFDTFKNVVETGIPNQGERHYVHEQFNGWFHQSVVKLNDGVATTTTDITQRKLAEQEVWKLKDEVAQKATDKYKALFNSIDEGFAIQEVVIDENGKVTDVIYLEVNTAFEQISGMKDVTGKKASELLPHLEQHWLDAQTQVYKTGKPLRGENYTVDLDRWITYQFSRIGDAGSPLIAAVFNDVTERKQRELHQQFLIKLSDTLRAELDADAIANRAIQMLAEHLRLDRCYVGIALLDDNLAIFPYQFGNEKVPPMPAQGVTLSDFPDALRKTFDETLVINDFQSIKDLTETEKQNFAALGFGALVVANVRKGEKNPDWSINAISATPRQWTPNEISLIEQVTERTWAAIERANAERALRAVSKSLEQQVEERIKEVKQTKDLLQSVFDASLHGIIVLQAVKNNEEILDFEILLHNAITQQWNGRTLLGKNYAEEFPAIRKDGLFNSLKRVLETGEPLNTEIYYGEGNLKNWFQVTAVKLGEDKLVTTAEDITLRKRGEEEIKKQLTILHHTEQLAQTGSWEYEIARGEFRWSEGMYRLFGLPQQMKVRPEIYIESSANEDRSVAKRIVNYLKKKHEPFEEIMAIKREGEHRLLKIKGSPVTDKDGKVQKIIGVDIDLTDIRKAEEKLKESRHWLEQTTKASPDSITVYDIQKKQPVYLNNCLAEWTGVSNEKLIDMGIEGRLKLIHPEDRLNLLHHNEKTAAAKDGEVITVEYRIKTDDDKIIWLRNRSKPFLRDVTGKVTHILSVLQNVTEEVQLHQQLKERTQFAEAILDASVDRITVFDQDYRFVAWNKRCEQIHYKKKEEVVGKTIFEMFPGVENYPEFMNAQELSLKGEFVHVPLVRDDYTGDYLELFYIPLKNINGHTYAVVNIMHDVSNYVISTEQLNALNRKLESKNIELEQKNEEITSFAFVASHDMKELLRKIHTFSDWLLQQEMGQLSLKGRNLVEKIGVSVHRMEILIDDILVLTKIHSDTHREEDVDLNKILGQVMDDMADQIQETTTVIKSDKLQVIKGNSNQVFYLFKNLISNAIKFQKPGNVPQVTITSEIVKGSEVNVNEPKEEYFKLCFTDNGFGFDQRYDKKIFQVFQRLHGKYEFEGTGIGLAICKKIMENHNGSITVQSEQGKGSAFSCYFPLH